MDTEMLKAIINRYGEDNILGFVFDNSAGITFHKGDVTMDNNFINDINCLQFVSFDNKGRPFHILKPISDVQAVYIRDSGVEFNDYDRISLRG